MSGPGASHPMESRRRAWRRLWRTALAIGLAPALGGAIFGAAVSFFEFGPNNALETLMVGAAFGAMFGAAFGIPLIGTLGLLFDWMARKRGWTRLWHYMLGGVLSGMLGYVGLAAYELALSTTLLPPNHWIAIFEFVTGGAIVAGLAWLIRRPDQD